MKAYVCALLTAATLAMPTLVHAAPTATDIQDPAAMTADMVEARLFNPLALPAVCDQVNLDDTQKGQLKDAWFAFAKQKNTLMANVKNAMMDVHHTFVSATATKDDANKSLADAKTAIGAMGDAIGAFHVQVFFDILKPEQRAPAMACAMAVGKMKKEQKLRQICATLPPATPPTKK